jgi:hypothetical protein
MRLRKLWAGSCNQVRNPLIVRIGRPLIFKCPKSLNNVGL